MQADGTGCVCDEPLSITLPVYLPDIDAVRYVDRNDSARARAIYDALIDKPPGTRFMLGSWVYERMAESGK